MAEIITLEVTVQEFDTILAALRTRQHYLYWGPDGLAWRRADVVCPISIVPWNDIEEIATEHGDALTPTEVGALCERLNAD